MSRNFLIQEVNDFASFEKLQIEWGVLMDRSPTQDVFLTWEWFYAWFKSYGKDANPRIIAVWDQNELVGIAPFMLISQKKYGLTFQVLRTLSVPQCDVGGFLTKDGGKDILFAIIDHLTAMREEWDLMEFNQFHIEAIETKALIENFSANGLIYNIMSNPHYYISYENKDWESYYSGLSRNFKKQIRRSQRNIEKAGNHKIQRYTGREVTWKSIQTVININRHSTYPLICLSGDDQHLHKELIITMTEKGWLDLFLLILNDEPIAYEYGFLYRGRTESWRVGFDRRIDPALSAGVFLTMNVLKTGFDEGQTESDFLRGDEGYKNSWRPSFREFVHIKAVSKRKLLTALVFIWLPKIKIVVQSWLNRNDQNNND